MGDMEDPVKGFYKKAPDTKGKFLEHGSTMLRFECEWRETGEPFGDRRRFALQYFLADDTLEILDKSSPYSRGGQFTKFIIRQRLPRLPLEDGVEAVVPIIAGRLSGANAMNGTDAQKAAAQGITVPNAEEIMKMSAVARTKYKFTTGPTVWAKTTSPITGDPVYRPTTAFKGKRTPGVALPGPATVGGFPVVSSLVDKPEFLSAADLICGGVVSVYGRPLLIKSCDPFTVAFYLHKLGVDQRRGFIMDNSTVATERAAVTPHLMPRGTVPLAPHTGVIALGSEEETRVNAKKILPTYRAERNFDNFYQLQGKILRFEARMDPSTCDPDDARREFVVSYYLEDGTLAIVEVLRDRKGASAVRWLSRGKHRNFKGEPDMEEAAAVLGHRPPVELPLDTQAAYDRIYASPGDRFGYGDGFGGQGYSGGIFGKADRVGAGGTGVPSRTDVGIRDPMTHAYAPPPRFFRSEDFYVGATIQLAHAPGQTFILFRPDGFTADYLAAREEQQVTDARDVYVADSRVPVPNLPLEATASSHVFSTVAEVVVPLDNVETITLSPEVHDGCLVLAKVLSGVLASAQEVVRQSDKGKHNLAPFDVVQNALERYGCRAPAVDSDIVEIVLHNFVVGTSGDIAAEKQAQENARATKHAPYRPKTPANQTINQTPGGSPLGVSRGSNINGMGTVATMDNPLHGPHFTDYLTTTGFENTLLIDFPKLFRTIKAVADRQQVLQPRLDKIISQLRMALMSSRTHLRRVFRDLDTTGRGIITFTEFRRMLLRHHLDIGLNDAQIRELLSRFPPAEPMQIAGLNEPAISWKGFVEVIVDSKTLAPGEMDQFLDFVRGARDDAPDGVGGTRVWPELYPHVNQVSSWTADMDLSRFGVQETKPLSAKMNATMTSTAASRSIVPPTVPVRAALPTRPYTATGTSSAVTAMTGPSHTLPVGGAPELPISRPRTAPLGTMDPRPAPERAVLDVVEALNGSTMGKNVLQRMRDVFGTKRLELFRALSLYDTARKHVLSVHSFVAAIVSAGLRLSTTQAAELTKEICRMAGGNTGLIPPSTDVFVDYNAFLDTLYA